MKPESVRWLRDPYIPLGKFTLLEGDPEVGKSWIALHFAAELSQEKRRTLMLIGENGVADTVVPRLKRLGAKLHYIHVVSDVRTLDEEDDWLGSIMSTVRPELVIVDPINAWLHGTDVNKAGDVRLLTRKFAKIAEQYRCAVLGVRHFNKAEGQRALYRGAGSIDLTAAARSVLQVGIKDDRRIMAHAKSSLTKRGSSMEFELDNQGFHWLGAVDITADELATEENPGERTAVEQAVEFLSQLIPVDPEGLPATDVKKQAEELGLGWRNVQKAKARLSIRSEKRSDGWYWIKDAP